MSPKLIKFGSFLFDVKKSRVTDAAVSIVAHLPTKLIFVEIYKFVIKTENKRSIEIILVSALLYWNSKINS